MKLKHLLTTALMATTLMLWSGVGWGQEEVIYTTGFEAAEGFTAGTTYNNTAIKYDGPSGKQWGTYYGTPSTTSPISGGQSMQMRWYTGTPSNLGYTYTDFDLTKVTKVEFLASNTLSLNVTASYSVDGGVSYTGPELFTLTGTATVYTYNISATGEYDNVRVRFTITLPDPIPTGTSRLYIDDITIYGIPSEDPELVADPIVLTSFGYGLGEGPSASQTFALTGSNLNGTDVTITAPTYFEVSLDDATFSSSETLTAFDGTETTIYTRLVSGRPINNYSGDITITGGGDVDGAAVAVSGKVVEAFAIPYSNPLQNNENREDASIQGFDFVSTVAESGYTRLVSGAYIETPVIDFTQFNYLRVAFSTATFGGFGNQELELQISVDGGEFVGLFSAFPTTTTYISSEYIIDLTGTYNNVNGKLRFKMVSGTNSTRFRDLSLIEAVLWDGTGNWGVTANWSHSALPSTNVWAVVNSGTLTLNDDVTVKGANINGGANLTILETYTLTADRITIKAGTDRKAGSLINNGTLTATIVDYQRYVPATSFEYFSSPIAGQIASVFAPLGTSSPNNGLFEFDVTNGIWADAIVSGATSLVVMKGYAFIANSNQTVTFSGSNFYSGVQSIDLVKGVTNGFNLVGNPYPSAISWGNEGGWTRSANIDPVIWINTADAPSASTFATYNYDTPEASTNWTTEVGADLGVIAPTQAFWVYTDANTTLTVNSTAQVHSANVVNKKSSSTNPLIRLQAQREGYTDEMVIYFHGEATEGLDRYDTRKKLGSGAYPQLYAPITDAILAVNSLPTSLLEERLVVPITLKSDKLGSVTITLTDLKGFDANREIHLVDKILDTQINLRDVPSYNVEVESTQPIANRFEVVIEGISPTSIDEVVSPVARIFASGKNIHIADAMNATSLEVYNTIGQKLMSRRLNGQSLSIISTDLPSGIYIVNVNTPNGRTVKRVYIE